MNQRHASWAPCLALATLTGALLGGCSDRDVTVPLRSLNRSGDASYVCVNAFTGEAVALSECTQTAVENLSRNLIALITQTATGEVALVNVPTEPRDPRSDEGVIDVDPSTPGYGFLRVGAHPADIVSSPDGQASFVSSADGQKPGIYALPTSCLGPPRAGQSIRDLTTWSACSLPSAPSKLELVLDPGTGPGACAERAVPEVLPSVEGRECPAALVRSDSPARWKLVAALPDIGSIAVIDAQELLDRDPGTFDACPIDRTYALTVDLPVEPIRQRVPEELQSCTASPTPTPAPPPAFTPHPADLALAGGVLYVADDQAPVIHRFDVTAPCAAVEMPPLLPVSFDNPNKVVTTTRVAVSPLTPSGKRFAYAVERFDSPMSSLMVFDVSPGSTERTPLLRPGSLDIPGESPDRLEFDAPIQDIAFIERDIPRGEGALLVGTACNPSPDPNAAGTEYQPTADFSERFTPGNLRGVFAMALLANGQMSVIDVEDFDAPCRRPRTVNPLPEIDLHGCANDPQGITDYARDGIPTVTNELSCRMVEPHRKRSAVFGLIDPNVAVRAPALRSFPLLTLPDAELGRPVADRPKLLAVDFPSLGGARQPAEVHVGSTRYVASVGRAASVTLNINPATAQQNSVALPLVEPRAYVAETTFLRFEGPVTPTRGSGIFAVDPETRALTLRDPGFSFCDGGVNDIELMRELGARRFELSGSALRVFAREHADAVWITGDFPEEDDVYWRSAPMCTRAQCEDEFGAFDDEELDKRRRFRVVNATADELTLESLDGVDPEFTKCCFPEGTQYDVRATRQWVLSGSATGVRHDVVAVATDQVVDGRTVFECVRDCDPRKRWDDPRVFEIATPNNELPGDACVREPQPAGTIESGVQLDEPAARCIYASPTARFAVYRGPVESVRNMTFSWEVLGTFQPLGLDFTALSTAVTPASIVPLPSMDWVTFIDSASLGLVLVDLDELRTLTPSIN